MREIRINLLPLIRKLEAVLKRGLSHELMSGAYQSSFKGKGLEFVHFREYVASDDALLIDWKASLKANKLMVRVLQEERNITVFFLLDVSDSMLFSSHEKLKCEYAAELVGTLTFAMQQVGDSVGLAMFSDRIVKMVPPATGKNQFYKIIRELQDPSLYGGKFDLSYVLRYILGLKFIPPSSVVFLISDFIGLNGEWNVAVKLAGLKYDFTTVVVRDPVDNKLPDVKGEIRLSDCFSDQVMIVNPHGAVNSYEKVARKQIEEVRDAVNKTSSSLLTLDTSKDFSGDMLKFFKVRQSKKE